MINIDVRHFTEDDWPMVSEIYRQGIATGAATFEDHVPEKEHWVKSHIMSCTLVAEIGGEISGFATLSPYSSRYVYRGVGSLSIYVAEKWRGQGVGDYLMGEFIKTTEENGFWTLQSRIFPFNQASISLHEKHGFRNVGYYEKIGMSKDGVWHDNIFMERRSKVVGRWE